MGKRKVTSKLLVTLTPRELAIVLAAISAMRSEGAADIEFLRGWPQLAGFRTPSLVELDILAEKINTKSCTIGPYADR